MKTFKSKFCSDGIMIPSKVTDGIFNAVATTKSGSHHSQKIKHNPLSLLQAAAQVAKKAHAPYSKFNVGSALLLNDGSILTGCNVENASYGLTICAERNAIFAAVAQGHKKFKAIAIVASGTAIPYPCGACRQVLAEFGKSNMPVFIASIKNLKHFEKTTLGKLLPKSFSL